MARPTVEGPSAGAIRALIDNAGRLPVRVTPGARSDSLAIAEGRLAIKVRAAPHEGQANEAVLTALAAALRIAPSRLRIVRGASSRDKLVEVDVRA